MAIQYKTANQLPIMEEVTDNTYALVEENGTLKRVSGSSLGGSGIKTAIIKSSTYDNVMPCLTTMASEPPTYSCINMTFEEAHQTIANGEPLQAIIMDGTPEGHICMPCGVGYLGDAVIGVPTLAIISRNSTLFWTADGISTTASGTDSGGVE